MENISSRVPAGESYLVLFDYKAVEEDEIDLEAGQVGGREEDHLVLTIIISGG